MSKEEKFSEEQEIDLSKVREKIGASFDSVNMLLFNMFHFLVRNALVIGILFVIGAGIGLFLDKTQKTYDNQLIVSPNFGSVEYMYDKINLLEAKIKERDVDFLKSAGIKNPENLLEIEVEPVVDIYALVNRSESNFEMIKLMAEDTDMKQIVEDPVTSRNYAFHLITFTTDDITNRADLVDPLLTYLNDSEYFKKVQAEYLNNYKAKMAANEQTIEQINAILSELASSGKPSNQVYINQNTQLNDVIKTKDELVREQGSLRLDLVNNDKIVKDSSALINIKNTKSVNGKLKFVLPILFVGLFLAIKLFLAFYKKQKMKSVTAAK